jgi:hypothetical protein
VFGLIRNDEWINSEYLGFNTFIAGSTFEELLEQYEQSLQMGYLSAAMLLKKFKEQFSATDYSGAAHSVARSGHAVSIKQIFELGDKILD